MDLQIEVTREDWDAFVRFVAKAAQRANKGRRYLIAIVSAAAIAVATGMILDLAGEGIDLKSFAGGAVLVVLWFITISRFRVFRLGPGEAGTILGARRFSISDQGIRLVSAKQDALFYWSAVRSVEVAARHIFVMVDANAAIIVPRRAFSSREEENQFLSELQSKSAPAQ